MKMNGFSSTALLVACLAASLADAQVDRPCPVAARNGDVNGDGARGMSDAVYLLNWLFLGGPAPCTSAGDAPACRCGPGLQDDDGDGICEPFPSGPIRGTFIHLGYGLGDNPLPAKDVVPFLNELRRAGVDTIVLRATRRRTVSPSAEFVWLAELPQKLGIILDEANALGMEVHVGLVSSAQAAPRFWEGDNPALLRDETSRTVAAILEEVGPHPALRGWYLPDEPGPCPPETHGYYAALVGAVRALSDKPVAVAPYLGAPDKASAEASPATVARRAADFARATGVDRQIWQDGVGSGIPLRIWGRPGSYSVEEYFEALRASLGQYPLWADVELFNDGEPLFVSGAGQSGAYLPAASTRVAQQLQAVRSGAGGLTERSVTWLAQRHSSAIHPDRCPGAARLLRGYCARHGLGGSVATSPSTRYDWETPPASIHPDDPPGELVDGRTADPRSPTHAGWSGVYGNASLVVDFEREVEVDWIGVHLLAYPTWGIKIPDSLRIERSTSTSGDEWAAVATIARPFDIASGFESAEYVMGNEVPLNSRCRRVRLVLSSPGWTFLSEIEISSDG